MPSDDKTSNDDQESDFNGLLELAIGLTEEDVGA
jgi:hypothetical protein